jgi:hypothetical protein
MGLKTKNDSAFKGQQQFTGLALTILFGGGGCVSDIGILQIWVFNQLLYVFSLALHVFETVNVSSNRMILYL